MELSNQDIKNQLCPQISYEKSGRSIGNVKMGTRRDASRKGAVTFVPHQLITTHVEDHRAIEVRRDLWRSPGPILTQAGIRVSNYS